MARKRKELPILKGIKISDVAAEGKALAKVNDQVIFIPYGAPGDVVDLQISKKRRNYMEAQILHFQEKSPLRIDPFCTHFETCGGCKWQHLPYSAQLEFKQKQVYDQILRIGKIIPEEILPIVGSEKQQYYRNKLEFTFSNKRWLTFEEVNSNDEFAQMNGLGFHIPGMFDKVLDIEHCYLQSEISNQIRNEVRAFALSHEGYPFFDLKNQNGFLRTLIIRSSSTGGLMVIVVFFEEDREKREKLLEHIRLKFPEITSLMYIINSKANDSISDQDVILYFGEDHMMEQMEDLKFKVGPKSFYQTNSEQAYNLYSIVRDFAQLNNDELVYDLYTGTGTIANFIAKKCRKVVGIEYVPEAIEDAKVNSSLNNLENTTFYAGDMKDILTEDFLKQEGNPDVIITDPPRAGMHEDVIKTILMAAPKRIVYVSCNPATQARDLSLLCQENYKATKMRPVDMFPHTHHIENVILLEKI